MEQGWIKTSDHLPPNHEKVSAHTYSYTVLFFDARGGAHGNGTCMGWLEQRDFDGEKYWVHYTDNALDDEDIIPFDAVTYWRYLPEDPV